MSSLDDFKDILKRDEPLAPYSWLKTGGSADYFLEPRNPDELQRIITCCHENEIPMHVLGGGSNLLVRDEGVRGAVLRIYGEDFAQVEIHDTTVKAGSGALLSQLVSQTVKEGLAGLELLVGIPGTVGGALHGNAGGRGGDIGQYVTSATVLTIRGERFVRTEDELAFSYRKSSVDELAVVECTLELKHDDPNAITQRMRKTWIMKKATQPLSFQSAGCIFKNPRGLSAGDLIEQAGMKGTRIGQAEISDRHANFVVTNDGTTSVDVIQLIEQVRTRVADQFGVDLELEIQIW